MHQHFLNQKMSDKNEIIDIISSGKRIAIYQKESSDDYSKAKNKNYLLKNDILLLFFINLFILLLHINKAHPKKDSFFEKSINPNGLKSLYSLFSNSYNNRKFISNNISIFPDFCNIELFFSIISKFFIIYIMLNYYHEIDFINLFVCFIELFLYNSFFMILLKEILIIELNSIITCEDNRKEENNFFTYKKRGTQNYLSGYEIGRLKLNKIKTNTRKLSINKNGDFAISINPKKEGKIFFKRNIIHLRNFIKITKYIILLNLFNNIFVNNKISLIEYNSYNITLKIKGSGIKKVFSSEREFKNEFYPDEVYINGYRQNYVNHSYIFNQANNIVELVWNNLINSSNSMFHGCSDITEIDFSNFNTSNIDNMNYMFLGCSSLTSVNLSNFDTSKVTKMSLMFDGCSSLTSLDLSNFDTSKVTWMDYMFTRFSSLNYLNLSNFITSKVVSMNSMFSGCKNLEYINMINFQEDSLKESIFLKYNWKNMFKSVPDNIVVCINEANIPRIYGEISNKTCYIEDCTNDWKLKQKKFINGTSQCVDNCPNAYPYEYNDQCYS